MNLYLVFALGMVVAAAKPSDPPKYTWDFSSSRSIEQVAWPLKLRGDLDLYYDVTANGVVKVVLPGGRVFEHPVERVSFCRLGDGERITSIKLVFEEQSIDEVYATATSLAETWGIPTAKLIAWKRVVTDEWSDGVMISRPDVDPSVAVEIFKTLDPKKPFQIHLGIAWDIRPFLAEPATQPANKARNPAEHAAGGPGTRAA